MKKISKPLIIYKWIPKQTPTGNEKNKNKIHLTKKTVISPNIQLRVETLRKEITVKKWFKMLNFTMTKN